MGSVPSLLSLVLTLVPMACGLKLVPALVQIAKLVPVLVPVAFGLNPLVNIR